MQRSPPLHESNMGLGVLDYSRQRRSYRRLIRALAILIAVAILVLGIFYITVYTSWRREQIVLQQLNKMNGESEITEISFGWANRLIPSRFDYLRQRLTRADIHFGLSLTQTPLQLG